jgi:hypothetical protein
MTSFGDQERLSLIKRVVCICFSEEKLNDWRNFLISEEGHFQTQESKGEYSHQHYALYENFISLIERSLREKCEDEGTTLEEIFELCEQYQHLPAVNVFVVVLSTTTTPESFLDLMNDSGKREYMFSIIKSWKNYFSSGK